MNLPFKRKKAPELTLGTAEQMLANVFSACDRPPNSVDLETLVSYSNYRKERYSIQRTVIVAVLTLFMLLPLLFIAAVVEIHVPEAAPGVNPVYTVSVSTGIPMRQIQARMDGRTVPVYETAPGEYELRPLSNGQMDISVTLLNRQETSISVAVESADTQSPELVSTGFQTDYIVFYVTDGESLVDFESVTITDPDGNSVECPGYDADSGAVYLPYPDRILHVCIPDIYGNVLSVDLKPET